MRSCCLASTLAASSFTYLKLFVVLIEVEENALDFRYKVKVLIHVSAFTNLKTNCCIINRCHTHFCRINISNRTLTLGTRSTFLWYRCKGLTQLTYCCLSAKICNYLLMSYESSVVCSNYFSCLIPSTNTVDRLGWRLLSSGQMGTNFRNTIYHINRNHICRPKLWKHAHSSEHKRPETWQFWGHRTCFIVQLLVCCNYISSQEMHIRYYKITNFAPWSNLHIIRDCADPRNLTVIRYKSISVIRLRGDLDPVNLNDLTVIIFKVKEFLIKRTFRMDSWEPEKL